MSVNHYRERHKDVFIVVTSCAFLWWLSNDADQRFVAGRAAEGEGDLEIAFDCDGVGEFEGELGEGEVGDGEDGLDDERVEVMFTVFKLDLDGCGGFAGLEIDSGGEEHDAGAVIGTEVKDVLERERFASHRH